MSSCDLEKFIVDIPDYPEPGVVFKDITPLISSPEGLKSAVDTIVEHFKDRKITKVVGAEARGFLIGAPVAYALSCGFVPARKPHKLPREVYSQQYALEYGVDEIQIHEDALTVNDKVLIIDDLVATAGTSIACAKLVEQSGATIEAFAFILELAFLHPREIVAKEYSQEFYSLIRVD